MPNDNDAVFYATYRTADGLVLTAGVMRRATLAGHPAMPSGQGLVETARLANPTAGEWIVSDGLGGLILATTTAMTPTVSSTTLDADGVDTVTISGLPNPSRVTVQHSSGAVTDLGDALVTDGSAVITSIYPGTIAVQVISPGKATWRTTIDCT